MRHVLRIAPLLLGATLLLAACDDDDADDVATPAPTAAPAETPAETPADTPEPADTPDPTPAEPATPADGEDGDTDDDSAAESITINGVDYAYEGVPGTVEVGATLDFVNDSSVEVHEIVLMHLPEGEDRSIEELLDLPEDEADQVFMTGFRGVSVALPDEPGMVLDGDLSITEPGRYLLLCFIPTGSDPDEIRALLEEEPPPAEDDEDAEGPSEPPELSGGPPHIEQGMWAEFTAE